MEDAERQQLIDGGAYDPAASNAEDRFDLLEFLLDLGATIEEILLVAPIPGGLPGLASIAAQPKPTVTLAEVAHASGYDLDRAVASWHALGLPLVDVALPVLSEEEAAKVVAFNAASAILPPAAELELLRVAGQSMARLADAFVQAYLVDVERMVEGELAKAQLASMTTTVLDPVLDTLKMVLLRHMAQSAIRLRTGQQGDTEHTELTIGFVDLVGFTSLSIDAAPDDLSQLLSDFESIASDAVAAHGGWIIKLIGDAVMFAALEPAHGVAIAAQLMTSIGARRPDLVARGGLASGPVLARAGDYFGSVVNLAARAEGEALEGEVLVDERTASAVELPPPGFVLEPAGRRKLRGISTPVALWSLRPADT